MRQHELLDFRLGKTRMFTSQAPSFLTLLILVIGTVAVIFWRTTIKLIAIAVAVLVLVGFTDILQSLH